MMRLTRTALIAGAGTMILLLPGDRLRASQDPVTQGQETFQTSCAPCHTLGGGRLIGPDLLGVGERRDEAWIIEFVQRSQAMIQSGDSVAVALFDEFGPLMMPDQPLSDDEVRAIIAYTNEAPAAAPTAPAAVAPVTEEQIVLGQDLFQGNTRFANGGPTCNSCHDVTNDAVIGGGVLAVELTTVFSRLGGAGVRAIIGSSPFPVMERAYRDKSLTEDEVAALVGFLERADAEQAFQQPRDYGTKLLAAGVGGAAVLLGLFSMTWHGRKRRSVNQDIYDRQVKSS